jgi:hypothetical protein
MTTNHETPAGSAESSVTNAPAPVDAAEALGRKRIAARTGLRAGLATTLAAGALESNKKPPVEGE